MSQSIHYHLIDQIEDIKEVVRFQKEIWGVDNITPLPHLVAAIHNGGMIYGAYEKKQLVGFCYGFAGSRDSQKVLVSHMMAILPEFRNRQIGEKLKFLQKEWAQQNGYRKIIWTYDPLESRNAYLNLKKLGAYVRTYYSSYYGEMSDELNKGMPSDRFLVEWDVEGVTQQKDEKSVDSLSKLVDWKEEQGLLTPVMTDFQLAEDAYVIAVPTTIHAIKKSDMTIALEWRLALRAVFTRAFSAGYVATMISKNSDHSAICYYVIEK